MVNYEGGHRQVGEGCRVCQQVKGENIETPGLLKALDIPNEPWSHIAMDFITGLPKSRGFEVIWVMIRQIQQIWSFSGPLTSYNS